MNKDIEWIECGLPYAVYDLNYTREPEPDFDVQVKELFGITYKESSQLADQHIAAFYIIENEIDEKLEESGVLQDDDLFKKEKNRLLLEASTNSESVSVMLRHRSFIKDEAAWKATQPEYIAWGERAETTYRKAKEECNLKSFSGRGLANPGTLIEIEDGSIHLIGSINENRGVCDDCPAFDRSTIVLRYAKIYDWSSHILPIVE